MTDINHMARLWAAGCSMGQIASAVGLTRSSVAGHIGRNRSMFARKNSVASPEPKKASETIVTATQKANARRQAFHAVKVAEEIAIAPVEPSGPFTKAEAEAYDASRRPFSKDLMAIRDCQCKWWVSDGPLMFCAEEVVAGKSWCAHHLKRSKDARKSA